MKRIIIDTKVQSDVKRNVYDLIIHDMKTSKSKWANWVKDIMKKSALIFEGDILFLILLRILMMHKC